LKEQLEVVNGNLENSALAVEYLQKQNGDLTKHLEAKSKKVASQEREMQAR